jgi:hypothetical protein
MTIWLINPYGPLPTEAWREYRYSLFGNYLSNKGYDVIWWTSNFSHHFKNKRGKAWQEIQINSKFKIILVPNTRYKSNISFARILRDITFSFNLYNQRKKLLSPDLIIYYESPFNFGFSGHALAKYYKVPVVFDQVDLWPELIVNFYPKNLKKILNKLLYFVYYHRNRINSNLNGFISLSKPYLEIPFKNINSKNIVFKEIIYNGIEVNIFRNLMNSSKEDIEISKILRYKPINELRLIFAGSLGPSYDINLILNTALKLKVIYNTNIHFIIAGDGPQKNNLIHFINDNNLFNVSYVGFLKPEILCRIYKNCDIGLSTYTIKSNVEMPDKFYDFTTAGLVILNSLKGEVFNWIHEYNLGFNYDSQVENDLYDKIVFLHNNRELLNNMKINSYTIASKFDINLQLKKLLKLVNNILNK